MQEILMIATIIAPVTSGLIQAIKKASNINKRYVPVMAVGTGVVLGAAAFFVDAEIGQRLWAGGISGLAATGLFELGKNTKKEDK
ncbi:holin [Virgibacillus kimchii]